MKRAKQEWLGLPRQQMHGLDSKEGAGDDQELKKNQSKSLGEAPKGLENTGLSQ